MKLTNDKQEPIYVLPTSINPVLDPYRYAHMAVQEAMVDPKSPSEKSAIEEILDSGVESLELRLSLILKHLESIQSTYLKNYVSIMADMISANNLLASLPVMRNYYFGREWSDLQKVKFGLREQMRRERTNRDKESGLVLKELRDVLTELKEEKSSNKMFDLEDAVNENIGGEDDG